MGGKTRSIQHIDRSTVRYDTPKPSIRFPTQDETCDAMYNTSTVNQGCVLRVTRPLAFANPRSVRKIVSVRGKT